MRSGCTVRIPYLTVSSNSVDRLMRLCAGSTAHEPGVAFRQTAHAGLCGAGWKRSNARRGCASAVGNHARGLGAGCWAGRSACPWPRRSPRCIWLGCPSHPAARTSQLSWSAGRPGLVGACRATGRRGPQAVISASVWVAAVSPTFGRLFEGTDVGSPGQTWPAPTHHRTARPKTILVGQPNPRQATTIKMNLAVMPRNCWQPNRKLLASVSDWSGGRQPSKDGRTTGA